MTCGRLVAVLPLPVAPLFVARKVVRFDGILSASDGYSWESEMMRVEVKPALLRWARERAGLR